MTVTVFDPDVPPPGAATVTVILAEPAEARREVDTVAVRLVAETKLDGMGEPFQLTTALATKPVPVSVIVCADVAPA